MQANPPYFLFAPWHLVHVLFFIIINISYNNIWFSSKLLMWKGHLIETWQCKSKRRIRYPKYHAFEMKIPMLRKTVRTQQNWQSIRVLKTRTRSYLHITYQIKWFINKSPSFSFSSIPWFTWRSLRCTTFEAVKLMLLQSWVLNSENFHDENYRAMELAIQ